MSQRVAWIAVVSLAVVSPVLLFPAVLGDGRQWIAAAVAIVVLAGAVGLAAAFGRLAVAVGVLAVTSVVGWVIAAHEPHTVNHFSGLALGLLTMGVVAAWCGTRQRLLIAVVGFVVCGVAAFTVGRMSAMPVHPAKTFSGDYSDMNEPVRPLPLHELHSRRSVNPNAVAAAAILVLPLAGLLAFSPPRWTSLRTPLRIIGVMAALWGGVVVLTLQSRSAWLGVVAALWVLSRRWVSRRTWWLVGTGVLVVLLAVVVTALADRSHEVGALETMRLRIEIWGDALAAFRPSPWFGIGFDYFRHSGYSTMVVWPRVIVGQPHAHNILLQTALDVGLIGLTAYLALTISVLRRATALARGSEGDPWVRHCAVAAALSVVSVHAFGLLDAVALGAKIGIFQWVSYGLILAAWRITHGR